MDIVNYLLYTAELTTANKVTRIYNFVRESHVEKFPAIYHEYSEPMAEDENRACFGKIWNIFDYFDNQYLYQ